MLKWQKIESEIIDSSSGDPLPEAYRAKIPGGWLVMVSVYAGDGGTSITFYPDANHGWDGSSC